MFSIGRLKKTSSVVPSSTPHSQREVYQFLSRLCVFRRQCNKSFLLLYICNKHDYLYCVLYSPDFSSALVNNNQMNCRNLRRSPLTYRQCKILMALLRQHAQNKLLSHLLEEQESRTYSIITYPLNI